MDFEIDYSIEVSDETLRSRSNLWLLKELHKFSNIEFDNKLTNRLRILQNCLLEVKFDISSLVDANVLTSSNISIKRSFGSLLLWLYDYLDSRPEMMTQNCEYLSKLNSKIIKQLQVYPSVFASSYYKSNTTTTIYGRILITRVQSQRLDHLLEFHQLIDNFKSQHSKFLTFSPETKQTDPKICVIFFQYIFSIFRFFDFLMKRYQKQWLVLLIYFINVDYNRIV